MKLLASLIIAASLVLGLIGAMTAYMAPLSLPDERLIGLELNSHAGLDPTDPKQRTPLLKREHVLTQEDLAMLRGQKVSRVHVKTFSVRRWSGWPLFVLGAVGMVGGAIMLKSHRRASLLEAAAATARPGSHVGPEAAFESIRSGVAQLQRELPMLAPDDRLRAILEILGEIQRTHVPAFVAGRPQLSARLGLAGYAQLMDSFAAAERQINRAWSAAADEVLDEALERVEFAAALLEEAEKKLNR